MTQCESGTGIQHRRYLLYCVLYCPFVKTVAYLSRCVGMTTWLGWGRTGSGAPAAPLAVLSCCGLCCLLKKHQYCGSCSTLLDLYNLPRPGEQSSVNAKYVTETLPETLKWGHHRECLTPRLTWSRHVTCSSSSRCLVRACSTSQPEAVDPVPKPVPLAQYSCCSSLVPAPWQLDICGCQHRQTDHVHN